MTYIPKNKIQSNLYTGGGEYIYASSGLEYTGYYYKLYNGKFYTGKTPNEPNSQELVILKENNEREYSPLQIPYNPLFPTPQDYQTGEFTRYFASRRNQPLFTEIDKATFTKYQQKDPQVSWTLYKTFSLFWKLTGDVNVIAQTNKNITELTEARERVFGLSLYLKENWIQYYK